MITSMASENIGDWVTEQRARKLTSALWEVSRAQAYGAHCWAQRMQGKPGRGLQGTGVLTRQGQILGVHVSTGPSATVEHVSTVLTTVTVEHVSAVPTATVAPAAE